jgi:hypothetical protein
LTREQRLRTERRIRELLEPEQLAVTEDDLEVSESELEVEPTRQSKTTVSSQVILILIVCFALRHLVKICHGALLELRFVNNQYAGNKKTKFL